MAMLAYQYQQSLNTISRSLMICFADNIDSVDRSIAVAFDTARQFFMLNDKHETEMRSIRCTLRVVSELWGLGQGLMFEPLQNRFPDNKDEWYYLVGGLLCSRVDQNIGVRRFGASCLLTNFIDWTMRGVIGAESIMSVVLLARSLKYFTSVERSVGISLLKESAKACEISDAKQEAIDILNELSSVTSTDDEMIL